MADQKISQLNSLTGANTASGDLVTVVDISDTTMGASGTNKKMTLAEFQASPVSAGTANGVLYLNGSKVATSGSALTFDGTNLATTGTASATKLIPTGGSATGNGMYLPAANALAWSNNGVETMRLDASGNLGIGTASPGSALEIARGAGVAARLSLRGNGNSAANEFFVGQGSAGNAFVYQRANSDLSFGTNNTTRMFLDASGNLGIGTVSPSRKLEVVGSAAALAMSVQTTGAGEVARFSDGTAQTLILGTTASGVYYNNANSGLHAWLFGGTERMRLDASGNLGVGVTPSAWRAGRQRPRRV